MRFPEFKNKNNETCYKIFLLGEICFIKRGRIIDKKYLKNNFGKYPVISSNTLNNGIFGYINTYDYDGEYITVTAIGLYAGTFFYQNQKFSITSNCILLSKKNNFLNINYLYNFLKKYEKIYLNNYYKGSIRKQIKTQELSKYKIILPSLLEQNKIAQFLSLIDQKIELQRKLIESNNSLIKTIKSLLISFKLRFKEFKKELIITTFGNETEYIQPQKYITRNYNQSINEIPVLTANKAFILGYTNEKNDIWNKGNCFIMDDFTLDSKYVSFPFKVRSSAIKIIISKKNNIKFIYELFKNLNLKSYGHMRHWISSCISLKIKITDINEQNKIVNFLNLLDKKNELNNLILKNYLILKKVLINLIFI